MENLPNIELKETGCCSGGCCHNHSNEYHHDHGHNHSHRHSHDHSHSHSCGCGSSKGNKLKTYLAPALSLLMLVAGLIIDHYHEDFFYSQIWIKPLWYFIAFLPVGFPVVKEAIEELFKGDYFNELTLMSIACIGAFLIGEYSEAVGVMLFYCIGENLQDRAVDKATRDISKLLDVRPESARLIKDGKTISVKPQHVEIGQTIEVRPGERVPLDGIMESKDGLFDTAALTGESVPREIEQGEEVLAGMIASSSTVRIKVNRSYGESAISRILDLVKNAQTRKAKSEVFIRKFARIYTPIVTLCALLVVIVPAFISIIDPNFSYIFSEWLYRALIFLVISCPCALVISVPLSYFAGIGAASKEGVLFKGGNYLEALTHINSIAFDKTGTLTTGEFSVDKLETFGTDEKEFLTLLGCSEAKSTHPLAKAIITYIEAKGIKLPEADRMNEISGKGTRVSVQGKEILTGNLKLMREEGINYPSFLDSISFTLVACAIDKKFAGYVIFSDNLKPDAKETITGLKKLGIDKIMMLSGDKKEIVEKYADRLDIKESYGELLPQDKAELVEKVAKTPGRKIAFVGDGMNDAPVLALSNIGIAMGGLGSDAAIESADIVIQTDRPSKVPVAIRIGKFTLMIVKQNIAGAIIIKIAVLALGLTGIATLWAAVFADVGVTMLAVLNSMRIMWKRY